MQYSLVLAYNIYQFHKNATLTIDQNQVLFLKEIFVF
jgi:hypothetical protein